MVYGRTQIWYSWQENGSSNQLDHFYDLGVQPNTLINPPMLFLLLLQNKCQTPTTCNALIRREIFEKIGKFEESFRTMYEDQVFFSKVLLNASVFVADECWAKYRQHPASCSSQSETQQYYLGAGLLGRRR
jgi:GT2 family glycosyltransferase